MVCRFCESYASYAINKNVGDFKASRPDLYGGVKWHQEITVALVVRDWTDIMGKKNAARTTNYRWRGLGYKLNFCPECGKKLERRGE